MGGPKTKKQDLNNNNNNNNNNRRYLVTIFKLREITWRKPCEGDFAALVVVRDEATLILWFS